MAQYKENQEQILVAGAGGQLGSRVVEILYSQGCTGLIAASRDPLKLKHFAEKGIETRKVDFNDPSTLHQAFKGIDRLLLISTDELHPPGLRIKQHQNAIDAAEAAGIAHIVYTSMPNPDSSAAIPFAKDHITTEQALRDSGINYTILRVSWYCENLRVYLPQIIQAGNWPTAAGNGKIAFVPREDVARVSAAALAKETDSRIYDITGSEALTVSEISDIVTEVFGRQIKVTDVSLDQFRDQLLETGIAEPFVGTVIMTDLNTKAGNFNIITDSIKQLTRRPPASLKDFLLLNASHFITID